MKTEETVQSVQSMESQDNKTTINLAVVSENERGSFGFSQNTIRILLMGFFLVKEIIERDVAVKLASLINTTGATIALSRDEVIILRTCVETRLTHCEKEREEGSKSFNPDAYIDMKLLLLDIREWLSVTTIRIKEKNYYDTEAGKIEHPIAC